MHSLKNKILFIFWLLAANSFAADRPSFLIDERAILDEFRGQLRSKLEDLSRNYITQRSSESIYWTSSEALDCAGVSRAPRAPLASLSVRRGDNVVSFELRGCSGRMVLRETFSAINAQSFSLSEYLNGKIPGGTLTRYVLQDSIGANILEWREKEGISVFTFINSRFLDIYKSATRWQYKAFGYSVSYKNEGNSFDVDMRFDPQQLTVEWGGNEVRIYDTEFRRISVNTFLIGYSHTIQNVTLSIISGIVKSALTLLPSTEFVASGGQNSRLLDEMRLTYTRLLNNLELNLVRQYIQEIIKAIESGLLKITDNRPEQ